MEDLVKYRSDHSLTQQEFATLLGTSAGYLHDLETGRRKPSVALAREIERITGGELTKEVLRSDIFDPASGAAA